MEGNSFDAVVIGSGFGGAVASCRLAQAGLRVLLLERGRRYEANDFPALPASDRLLPDLRRWTWQNDQGLWDIQDLEEIVSVQAAGYGGGSLIYANVHLRPPASVFDASWPQKYRVAGALDDYFDLAAYMLDVAPISERPGEPFVKTTQLKRVAGELKRDAGFFLPPLAVNYANKVNDFGQEQNECNGCGKCCSGCPRRAKNSLDLNYLAVAEKYGARVRTQCEVTRVRQRRVDAASGAPHWTVDYVDHLSAGVAEVHASAVFLCAGAVHSTRLLAGARLQPQSRDVRSRVGLGYFPNADAAAVVYDTAEEVFPSQGPTITTSTVQWNERNDSFFMIQDGGYAPELERLSGILRAPLWAGRNRLSVASSNGAPPATPTNTLAFPGLALVSPLDAALDAVSQGALGGTVPGQLRQGWSSVLKEVQRPLLLPALVDCTIERALRAKQQRSWLSRWHEIDSPLNRAMRWVVKRLARATLGRSEEIGDHALRGLLRHADSSREQVVREVLGYDAGQATHRMMLLAMGRDAVRGVLRYDPCTRRLIADLDLYHLAPGYTAQELLMGDIARKLGGEMRTNPAFAFLGKPITVHSQGGCRMSDTPDLGVTMDNGQVHGCPGLYVLDGSVLCQSVGVNPAPTILAIAERNILEFIRSHTGFGQWPVGDDRPGAHSYRQHRDGALVWKARAKGWKLAPPSTPTVKVASEPLGLSFHETMQGYCAPIGESPDPKHDDAAYRAFETNGRPKFPVLLKLAAKTADLGVFFEDLTHRLELAGTISLRLPGAESRQELPVTGHLELFVPRYKPYGLQGDEEKKAQRAVAKTYTTVVGLPKPNRQRFMRYHLSFDEDRWRLEGYKRIRQDPGLDAWRDTAALFTRIGEPRMDGAGNKLRLGAKDSLRVHSAGVVHVDLTGFLYDQLRSFEVTGATDPATNETDAARVSWAIAKFAGFFFGTLQRVYMPETKVALETLFQPRANNVRHEPARWRM